MSLILVVSLYLLSRNYIFPYKYKCFCLIFIQNIVCEEIESNFAVVNFKRVQAICSSLLSVITVFNLNRDE